ncbi:MAG TPA: YibE/F family protein [bacterium]|nr:YibE/F family protein [bacterium]
MWKRFLLVFIFVFFPLFCLASEDQASSDNIFNAKVIEILEEVEKESSQGEKIIQQNLKLQGLEGPFENTEFVFYGIGDIELVGNKEYSVGEKVLVIATQQGSSGDYVYYITEKNRSAGLIIIFGFFLLLLFLIGKWKGVRSILSLGLTFFVIVFFMVPQIMGGANPVFIVLFSSLLILLFVVYLTEGLHLRSHLAVLSIFISLVLVVVFSSFFIFLTKLTGVFSEDVFALINVGQQTLNLKGLLLAGMIIGALGVLDDVVISQIVSVEKIIEANPYQSWREVFKKAQAIGVSHISSMTNTLFLAYAGASLPLLILFVSDNSPFSSIGQIMNNEAVSTEIVRALSGSLGIILAVPISTFIASWAFVYKNNNK